VNHHFGKDNLGREWTPWTLVVLRGPTPQVGHTPQVGPTPQGQNKVRTRSEKCQTKVITLSEQDQNKVRTMSEQG
jgi:hypothetical protein